MALGTIRLSRSRDGQTRFKNNIVGFMTLFLMITFLICLSTWFSYDDYFRRAEFGSEHYLEAQGVIEDAHVESSGRSNPMYFRVGDRWFKLPYGHPQDCYPRSGELTKLDFAVTADNEHRGPPAHTIYRLQLKHGCRIGVWG